MLKSVIYGVPPFRGIHTQLHLDADPAGTAGGTLTTEEKEFQTTVRRGVTTLVEENKKLRSDVQKITDDFDRADKEVKKALEELTKVKNTCNDQAELMRKMEQTQKAIKLNARSSFGDPIRRALANEEARFYLNAVARYVIATQLNAVKSLDPAFVKAIEDGNVKAKALTGVDSGLGQATVPTDTFDEIFDTLLEYGQWNTLGVQRVGARTTVLPVATSRPAFYWIGNNTGGTGEGSVITSGAFAGSSVNLVIQTLAVLMYVARELLADSTVDLAPYVLRQMVESIAQGADTVAFVGTGAADQTNAGYYGIFNIGSVNTNCVATAGAGNTSMQATQLEDWVRCLTAVNPAVLQRTAKWWLHPQMLALAALVRDKNGRPIFQTWLEVPQPGAIGSILGYPVIPTGIAPTANNAGSVAAVFGDPQGYAVGIRSDLELATSEDIGFPQNLMAYRALMRMGGKAKTTANSTTLIPFAALTLAAS